MHATGCRKDYLFKLKSERQHTSCRNQNKEIWHTETKESLLWATVNGKLNLTVTKNKLSAISSLMVVQGLTSTVQTMGRTNMRMEVEPKTCCLIPSHPWFLPITLLCSLARSHSHFQVPLSTQFLLISMGIRLLNAFVNLSFTAFALQQQGEAFVLHCFASIPFQEKGRKIHACLRHDSCLFCKITT